MVMKKDQATLTLHLLGRAQLRHGKRSLVDELAGKEQALFIYLACQPRRRFSRDHLSTLFWGEIPQSRARYNLRRALWKLRRALEEIGVPPDDCIVSDASWIHLSPNAPCWVDALTFEEALKVHFRGAESQINATGKRIAQIRHTLDLYRGDFLAGFSILHAPDFEEWVTLERERLFLLLLRALTNLIQAFIGQGQHVEAIDACHRILALDALQEDIHRLLMRLYWETGQRAQAIRQYQTYQELLQRELGIQPLEETQALYQRILRQKTPPTVPSSSLALTSRLTPPTPPTESFVRPRLINLLDQGLDARLTLVSAPPGYGKTTLVAQWLHAHASDGGPSDLHFTWYKVSPVDNDPTAFLESLAASIARIHPDVNQELQNEIRDVLALRGGLRQATGCLINALESLNAHPLVIILDDEERLNNPESLQILQQLIDFLPVNGCLYVLTRIDPDLALPRLRIRGQLLEIRAPDLRFTSEEARAFLRQATGPHLKLSDVEDIVRRAEGWAAPLWLAANAFKRFASSLDTVWEGVAAYLRDEVLAHQSPEMRAFLLRSAVLDCLTPDLCHAVLDLPHVKDSRQAAHQLNEIERRNLFIQRLSSAGPGESDDAEKAGLDGVQYIYHPLFRSFLRAELAVRLSPAEIQDLHRRAAQALEARRDLQSAFAHYQQAGEGNDVARLLDQGVARTSPRWLDRLDSASDQRPQVALSAGQLHQAEGRLAQAEISLLHGRYAQGLDLARQAMARWDALANDVQRRTAGLCTIGQLQICRGELEDAQATLKEAQHLLVELSSSTLIFQTLRTQAWAAYVQGAYHRAMALNRRAEQEASCDVPPEIVAAFCNPAPAILREWGEGEIVRHLAHRRVLAAHQSQDRLALIHAYVDLGDLHLDQGERGEAADAYRQAIEEADALGENGLYRLYALARLAYLHFLQGDPYALVELEGDAERYEGQNVSPLEQTLAQLIAALPAVHQRLSGAAPPAPRLYERLADVHRAFDRIGAGYGAFVSAALLGRLYLADDESPPWKARRYISIALDAAAAERYIQTLVVSPALSLPLLRFGLREAIEPRFAGCVLARIGSEALPGIIDLSRAADPCVRERAITALVAFGTPDQNIDHRETVLSALTRLAQDDDPTVRALAGQAHRKFSPPS